VRTVGLFESLRDRIPFLCVAVKPRLLQGCTSQQNGKEKIVRTGAG
jgi:hypothetical protein